MCRYPLFQKQGLACRLVRSARFVFLMWVKNLACIMQSRTHAQPLRIVRYVQRIQSQADGISCLKHQRMVRQQTRSGPQLGQQNQGLIGIGFQIQTHSASLMCVSLATVRPTPTQRVAHGTSMWT